ncbi:hypothetical protein E3N88_21623 [Mikania micrantha]|uniref:Knottins-like domain-containing protein n=1 Tax=Mikania micrantha TaxID=192012 RepID=A0A5N6N816_9ASTR|nr:hypothetical protein E3N88_21623 [Mikania micrantha]
MAFLHHNSTTISMEIRRSINPTPPVNFNLFLSIQTPRFLFMQKVNKCQQLYHCNSVSPSDQQLRELVVDDGGGGGGDGRGDDGGGRYDDVKGQFGNLVKEHGWQVRRMVEEDDEMRSVANIQAEAFYEPVVFFNDVFFQFFQAEVLSGLLYRLRNSPSDRYACLVAETTTNEIIEKQLVGVVDATVFRDASVLEHLSGADEYLYVSGIAVLHNFSHGEKRVCDRIVDERMVKVTEAKMCRTTGHSFSCVNDMTCNSSCEKQGFAEGKCDGVRRRCTCYKQC